MITHTHKEDGAGEAVLLFRIIHKFYLVQIFPRKPSQPFTATVTAKLYEPNQTQGLGMEAEIFNA